MERITYLCDVKSQQKMKIHLKKGNREITNYVDSETNELIGQEIKQHTYVANTREEFFLGYVKLLSVFYEELTGPEIKVYSYLLAHYRFDVNIGLIKSIKTEIANKLGIKLGTVDNAVSTLSQKKLIYNTGKGSYKLNPRYAFKGSTSERQRLMKVMLELECKDC